MRMPVRETEAGDGVKKAGSRHCLRSEEKVIMEGPAGPSFLWVAIKVESIEKSMSMPVIAFDVP
jgi:hypothetical protein